MGAAAGSKGPWVVEGLAPGPLLKAGGMGAVYAARRMDTGAPVAIKIMTDTHPAAVERFQREAQIAARLDHPNIVAGRGAGCTREGTPWLAMELLRGQDLEARLRTGVLPVADVVAIAVQVCSALEHAHARGVIHRDLKPSNVFLCDGPEVQVKVLDFGVARVVTDRQLTRTGTPVGTPSYMSPEQARGDRDLDARSDLWSLGVVLYECLAGRLPFQAMTFVGTLYAIVNVAPVDLVRVRPGVPRALAELVHRTLAKSRDDRPSSAAALRADLVALGSLVGATEPPAVTADQAGSPATLPGRNTPGEEEVRLVSVVSIDQPGDRVFIQDVAHGLRGRTESLATGAMLVLFGVDRWSGDEPQRAVRLALAVSAVARAIGVATGRALRSAVGVEGAVIDAAAGLCRAHGVHLDATTAGLVREQYDLKPLPDGSVAIDPRASRPAGSGNAGADGTAAFVGRDMELTALLQSVDRAEAELGTHAVVVLGPPGIGKSRLLTEALARLAQRETPARVVMLRCESLRRDAPFAALRDALAGTADASVVEILDPTRHRGGDPVVSQDRVRTSLLAVLEGMATSGPVVWVVDDAQWLDLATRAAGRWIREHATDLPLAVWVLGQPEAAGTAADMAGPTPCLHLGPLARVHAVQLLQAVAGDAPEELLERAGGHPLFLEELGRLHRARTGRDREPAAPLPASVEGALLAQLDQLAPQEREFLKRAAVFGRTWWGEGVASLGGDLAVVPRLRAVNVIVPRPRARLAGTREYAFRTGVLQEVAYGLLPPALRGRYHDRAADWLMDHPAVASDELARHWELGGHPDRAAQGYAAAVESAAAVADTPTACCHAARGLALTDDPRVQWRILVARDNALQVTGDLDVQRAGLDALDALAMGLGPAQRTEAAWRRLYLHRIQAEAARAQAAGVRAVQCAEALADPRWGALVHVELALLQSDAGDPQGARAHAVAARDLAARVDEPWLQARTVATLAYATADTESPDTVRRLFDTAAEGFLRVGDRRRAALMDNNAGSLWLRAGRIPEASERLEAAVAGSRRVGNTATVAAATHNLGVIRRIQGDLAAAGVAQDQAWDASVSLVHPRLASYVATERVYLALAADAGSDVLGASVREARRCALAVNAPALVASARAVALHVAARTGGAPPEALAEARGSVQAVASDEGRLELASAIVVAGGGAPDDVAVARAAMACVLARVGTVEDRDRCRDVIVPRYRVPPAVFTDEPTSS